MDRITVQTRGIVDDVKTWVELRIELLKQEVEDRVNGVVGPLRVAADKEVARSGVLLAVFGLLAAVFFLLTLSFALSALYVWWFAPLHVGLLLGFLTMFVLLALLALGAKLLMDGAVKKAEAKDNTFKL
ncbi:MAG: hypothetical protein AAGF99_05015 [Bacteroidota bacterium]